MPRNKNRNVWTPQQTIEGFVRRARRIMGHSLLVEHLPLMQDVASGTSRSVVTENVKTGESSVEIVWEFPPEEAIESLTARLRPVIEGGEPIYYTKVLDALAELVPEDSWNERLEPLAWWRGWWDDVANRDKEDTAQAYVMINDTARIPDTSLMYRWVYSDTIHADELDANLRTAGIAERFRAACGVIARICGRVDGTLLAIQSLVDDGVLTLGSVFDEEVLVKEPTWRVTGQVYASTAPDSEVPTDLSKLDPAQWQPINVALREAGAIPPIGAKWPAADPNCRICRGERLRPSKV